ncbi:MAG: Holliday junction resolvase RuvX [Dehalococcoidia bacterium]|jgi:putative Holliday junction resolvase
MRILGLDVGDSRIGVAICDPVEIIATPLTVITRDDDNIAIAAIGQLVGQYDVKRIVIGLPYSLDGSIGRQANKVKDFVDKLSQSTRARIELRDERLSTVAAQRLLRGAGNKKAGKRSHLDAAAAAFILQGYLDSLKVCD